MPTNSSKPNEYQSPNNGNFHASKTPVLVAMNAGPDASPPESELCPKGDPAEVVLAAWLPPTPSSSATASSSGVDWLERNRRRCEPCLAGGPCCRRSQGRGCTLGCPCHLTDAWVHLTDTDDHRRAEDRRKRHERKFPPAPPISTDEKFVAAWRETVAAPLSRQQWLQRKRRALQDATRDKDNVNFQWQGWDHRSDFGTTSANYGTPEKADIKGVKELHKF